MTDEKWLSFAVEQVRPTRQVQPRGAVKIYLEGGALVIEDTASAIAPEDCRACSSAVYGSGRAHRPPIERHRAVFIEAAADAA